jgi:hypothetical protein
MESICAANFPAKKFLPAQISALIFGCWFPVAGGILLIHSMPERAQEFLLIPLSKPHFCCLSSFLPLVVFCLWMFSSASDQSFARAIFILPLRVLFSRCLFRSGLCARPQLLERWVLARQDPSALSCSGRAAGSSSDSFGLCVPQRSCFDLHPRLQIPAQVLIPRFWLSHDVCFGFCWSRKLVQSLGSGRETGDVFLALISATGARRLCYWG